MYANIMGFRGLVRKYVLFREVEDWPEYLCESKTSRIAFTDVQNPAEASTFNIGEALRHMDEWTTPTTPVSLIELDEAIVQFVMRA